MLEKFKNKKIIITGHTGFKGSWLTLWLYLLGAKITGISLSKHTNPSHYELLKIKNNIKDIRMDITNYEKLNKIIKKTKPDYFFHLAAQALVKKSFSNPLETIKTNIIGTANILESLKNLENDCAALIITSDKCYKNKELIRGYKENDEFGGDDPYSGSKASAEIIFHSYFDSFFQKSRVKIASARAGNVIGGGDWSENRIIPDCIRAWSNSKILNIRNPHSTRPWQHVLEPISGYLNLALILKKNSKFNGSSFNFGPNRQENQSVLNVVEKMSKYWKNPKWKVFKQKNQYQKETNLLQLNCRKARDQLKWRSNLNFNQTVKFTSEWYNFYNNNKKSYEISVKQIKDYTNLAKKRRIKWAQ